MHTHMQNEELHSVKSLVLCMQAESGAATVCTVQHIHAFEKLSLNTCVNGPLAGLSTEE